jgi:hypothetical protein
MGSALAVEFSNNGDADSGGKVKVKAVMGSQWHSESRLEGGE